ncbi:MAG TPA: acyl-CoA thioesterase domain-containing protein [Acidimicrobiia bacterium]|nr:acyl-CoA thioesterase domain-containing protein [Acidimicrobiia bacterium]
MSASAFLGAQRDGTATTFHLGDTHRGAFGGVFGGGIAAATLFAARAVAPDRRPVSLHCTFLRTLAPGTQTAEVEVVADGRTVTTALVRLTDGEGDLAAVATAIFAADDALYDFDAAPLKPPELDAFDAGWELPLPKDVEAPIMSTLPMRITGMPRGGFAHAIRAPWPDAVDVAEAAAMMGDYCAGLSVGAALGKEGTRIPVPNPDLSLRFTGEAWGDLVVGVGRLARIDRGAAAIHVEVWTGPDDRWAAADERVSLLAVGVSSAVLLDRS